VTIKGEDCLSEGKPDIQKINPFALTMPDSNYWAVGEQIGKAWSVGKGFGGWDVSCPATLA
jgi:hypothetical protein